MHKNKNRLFHKCVDHAAKSCFLIKYNTIFCRNFMTTLRKASHFGNQRP